MVIAVIVATLPNMGTVLLVLTHVILEIPTVVAVAMATARAAGTQ